MVLTTIVVSLGSLAIAGAMFAIAVMNTRKNDLDRIDRKTDSQAEKITKLEEKLERCERGREELRAENLTLLQRLVRLETVMDELRAKVKI